jgi:type II secretory pathway pseudopilin PulG
MTERRMGFTLIELLIVVVLGSTVIMATLGILITNQQIHTVNTATVAGQQSTRMAADILSTELREVSASGGDILSMSATSLEVRLMRKFSLTCATDLLGTQPSLTVIKTIPAAGTLTNAMALMSGISTFAVGDQVFVYADNDPGDPDDDVWIPATVDVVAVSATSCNPFGGDPLDTSDDVDGVTLTFTGQKNDFSEDLLDPQGDFVDIGAPVRSYLEYTFSTMTRGGDEYLARREGNGAWVPMVGPLRATNGLEFVYRDAMGVVTNTPADVRQIEVTVRTGSTVLNSLGDLVSDEITMLIYTRN